MNRKLLNGLLVLTVAAGGAVAFTSCKDDDFATNTVLTETSLQAQIEALRNVTDSQFYGKLKELFEEWIQVVEGPQGPQGPGGSDGPQGPGGSDGEDGEGGMTKEKWLEYANEYTSQYSNPYNWTYEQFVQATNDLYTILENIKAGNYEEVSDYVDGLYNMMFENIFPGEDWFQQIFENETMINNLLKRATSVEISQVWNQVFGSVNLPLDVKSTILATYVFKNEGSAYEFPTGISSHVTSASPDAPESEIIDAIAQLNPQTETLGKDVKFTENGNAGNMGSAVVTINPANNLYTDPDKYTIELINSKGEVAFSTKDNSKGTLALTDYDDLLYFGATRSAVPGVYSLNVNANPDNYGYLTVDLDKSGLKSALKQLVDDKSLSSIAHLSETVLKSVNNKLPAYAVKVSWNEDIYDSEETEANAIYSGFDLAAAVVHPLSYGSDLGQFIPSGKRLPVIHNTLAEYLEKIQNKIDVDFNADKLGTIKIQFNAVLTDRDINGTPFGTDSNGNTIWKVMFKYTDQNTGQEVVSYYDYDISGLVNSKENMAELQTFVDAILNAMNMELQGDLNWKLRDTFNKINERIKDYQGRVNDYLERLKNSSRLDYAQKLLDFYNDIAKRANKFLTDPNHYLQVVMGYTFGDGPHYMSNDIFMPLEVSMSNGSKLDLVTTSYTGDIVIPSYKKYVAITGVKNANDRSFNYSTEGIEALNTGDLNKVYNGTQEKIQVDLAPLQGKSVRLTYVSVDYRGACSMENYYLTVQ